MRRLALITLLAGSTARAEVDWAAALVTARGVGPADLRSPSPEIARVGAERMALERGRAELKKALRSLPIAAGSSVGGRADTDRVTAEALAELVEKTDPRRTLYSDGSVVVEYQLPLGRVAEVMLGVPPPAGEPSSLLVDAGKLKLKPALGYRVRSGATVREAPVVFVASAADPRAAAGRVESRATAVKDGVITVDLDETRLAGLHGLTIFVLRNDP